MEKNLKKISGNDLYKALSDKAWKFYDTTQPLDIYEYETESGTKYAIKDYDGLKDNMTFQELDYLLSELYTETMGMTCYLVEDNATKHLIILDRVNQAAYTMSEYEFQQCRIFFANENVEIAIDQDLKDYLDSYQFENSWTEMEYDDALNIIESDPDFTVIDQYEF